MFLFSYENKGVDILTAVDKVDLHVGVVFLDVSGEGGLILLGGILAAEDGQHKSFFVCEQIGNKGIGGRHTIGLGDHDLLFDNAYCIAGINMNTI